MRLLLRAARIIVSRHRFAIAIGAILLAAAAFWLTRPRNGNWTEPHAGADIGPEDGLQPRTLLNRVWFDQVPNDPRASTHMWLFFGGGCGFHQAGTWDRWTTEIFTHELENERIVMNAVQDQPATTSAFRIERCNHAPFDLCLTLDTPGGGPKTLYGFSRRTELSARALRGDQFYASARERTPCSWYD